MPDRKNIQKKCNIDITGHPCLIVVGPVVEVDEAVEANDGSDHRGWNLTKSNQSIHIFAIYFSKPNLGRRATWFRQRVLSAAESWSPHQVLDRLQSTVFDLLLFMLNVLLFSFVSFVC